MSFIKAQKYDISPCNLLTCCTMGAHYLVFFSKQRCCHIFLEVLKSWKLHGILKCCETHLTNCGIENVYARPQYLFLLFQQRWSKRDWKQPSQHLRANEFSTSIPVKWVSLQRFAPCSQIWTKGAIAWLCCMMASKASHCLESHFSSMMGSMVGFGDVFWGWDASFSNPSQQFEGDCWVIDCQEG